MSIHIYIYESALLLQIMGSNDYIEAFEKLTKLRLTTEQNRQMMRVIYHCCAGEQAYNPYYGAVLGHILKHDKQQRFTAQMVLWDVIKEWRQINQLNTKQKGQTSVARQINNIAKMTAMCVEQGSLNLKLLKVFDFDSLESTDALFLHTLFTSIFTALSTEEELRELAHCLIVKREVDIMRNGVNFFMLQYFLPLLRDKPDRASQGLSKVAKKFIKLLQ